MVAPLPSSIFLCRKARSGGLKDHQKHIQRMIDAREYKIHSSYDGECPRLISQGASEMMTNASTWKIVPPSHRNSRWEGLCFRVASRVGSLAHQNLRRKRYPEKLFTAMRTQEEADKIMEDYKHRRCLMCDFSQRFVQDNGNNLRSVQSLEELEAIASQWDNNTVDVECGNASIRRELHHSTLQTHMAKLENISAGFLARQERRSHTDSWFRCDDVQKNKKKRGRPRKKEKHKSKKGTTIRRGGGAWRTWCHLKLRGRKATKFDFTRVAEEYRSLSTGRKEELKSIGRTATFSARVGGQTPYRSQTVEPLLKRQRTHDAHDVTSCTSTHPPADSGTVEQDGSGNEGVSSTTHVSDGEGLCEAVVPVGLTFEEQLQRMRQDDVVEYNNVLAQMTEEAKDVRDFDDQRRTETVASIAETLPKLDTLVMQTGLGYGSFHVTPRVSASGGGVEWYAPSSQIASLAVTHGHYGDKKAYRKDWQARHLLYLHDDCKPLPPKQNKIKQQCRRNGICCHKGDGKELRHFIASLSSHMRRTFPKGDLRTQIDEGHIVMYFTAERPVAEEDSDATPIAPPDRDGDDYMENDYTKGPIWAHVGTMYFQPVRPTFLMLQGILKEGGLHAKFRPHITRSEGLIEFRTVYECFTGAKFDFEWSVEYYVLGSDELDVCSGDFLPARNLRGALAEEDIHGFHGTTFWKGSKAERTKRGLGRKKRRRRQKAKAKKKKRQKGENDTDTDDDDASVDSKSTPTSTAQSIGPCTHLLFVVSYE